MYLSDPPEKDDKKFDILVWWKKNNVCYPVLTTMIRYCLATLISIVYESAFSTGGRVLYTFRNSLSPNMDEALIFCQN